VQSFAEDLVYELRDIWQSFRYGVTTSSVAIRNQLRLIRGLQLDYVVIPIGGTLPERSGPRRSFIQRQLPFPPEPVSLQSINEQLKLVAAADNVKGVVFIFQNISAGLAKLQNLRRAIERIRADGKEVVVFTPYLDLAHFFVASAADRIIAPPSATFEVLGLNSEVVFLKDALDRLGVVADVLQISPYKTAYNMFDKSDITPQQREQIDWLLDDLYQLITKSIAEGRNLSQDSIRELIDGAPLSSEEALAAGLVDNLAYEDTLVFILATESESSNADSESVDPPEVEEEESEKPKPKAKLISWPAAKDMLLEKAYKPTKKYIGVVSLEGNIVMGPSRQPPIDIPIPLPIISGAAAGEATIVKQLRRAEKDRRLAVLIFLVDSNGGSPLASDIIWRQIQRIAQKKPVLAYLGDTAASGGYYVSLAADHIMAQSATITGSIGVITAHISTGGFYEKIDVNRVGISRGARASMHSDLRPLNRDQRQVLWELIVDTYERFKKVVADGRELPYSELDPICEGRVWTGKQALEHRLVDSNGDFIDAIRLAAEMAELPMDDEHDIPVVNIFPGGRGHIIPSPFTAANELARLFSTDQYRLYFGRPMMLMPYNLKFW
jgi:protease-4